MRNLPRTLMGVALLSACSLAQAATVAEVFNGDMLNTNQRHFESVAGIPSESHGDEHQFRIQDCTISASMPGGTVTALRLELTSSCQANISSFLGDSFAPPADQPLTVGSFQQSTGDLSFYASCLSGCGNAADPSVYAHWKGPHAVNSLEVMLEVVLAGDAALDASNKWQEDMVAAKGEDFVFETRFNCERDFNTQAQQYFGGVVVDAITIGSGLVKPGC